MKRARGVSSSSPYESLFNDLQLDKVTFPREREFGDSASSFWTPRGSEWFVFQWLPTHTLSSYLLKRLDDVYLLCGSNTSGEEYADEGVRWDPLLPPALLTYANANANAWFPVAFALISWNNDDTYGVELVESIVGVGTDYGLEEKLIYKLNRSRNQIGIPMEIDQPHSSAFWIKYLKDQWHTAEQFWDVCKRFRVPTDALSGYDKVHIWSESEQEEEDDEWSDL
jgi:hypothetical protein